MDINHQLLAFKEILENAIVSGGLKGKESAIRSSAPINLIHDAVKYELIKSGVCQGNVLPHLGATKPEVKLAGFLKQKDQDVCVLPANITEERTEINWGPLAFERKVDPYGFDFSTNTLVINVRSQMSSLAKNSDTLFERTFAEALNLHMRYPEMVLGEVYLIPTHEYDDNLAKENIVGFKSKSVNLEKYISFFDSVNNRKENDAPYRYERCALLIVDFNREQPYLYNDSSELISDGLLPKDFGIEYETLNFQTFASDILSIYASRYNLDNLKTDIKL